jgi:rhodanese-related sulfurtransferase
MVTSMKELLGEAKRNIRELDPRAARAEQEAEPRLLVIDVRESEELASGRLPGAFHVPRGLLEPKAAPDSPARDAVFEDPERPLLLYCASGARSALAADTLRRMGFTRVSSLAGGIMAWKQAGLPVE